MHVLSGVKFPVQSPPAYGRAVQQTSALARLADLFVCLPAVSGTSYKSTTTSGGAVQALAEPRRSQPAPGYFAAAATTGRQAGRSSSQDDASPVKGRAGCTHVGWAGGRHERRLEQSSSSSTGSSRESPNLSGSSSPVRRRKPWLHNRISESFFPPPPHTAPEFVSCV